MGRTTTYTATVAAEILERLSAGEPLAQICRDEHMPAVRTVSDWKVDPSFAADFVRAREDGHDAIAAQCLEIADDGSRDYSKDEDGRLTVDHDHIQRSKLRVETRLKLLAKWDKRYGEKLGIEHSGTVGRAPSELSEAEIEARLAALQAKPAAE